MDAYIFFLAGLGALVLVTAWLPMLTKELPLSLPIICVGIGAGIPLVIGQSVAPHPLDHLALTERITEFIVIIALMGAGLKLDKPFSIREWRYTWGLLFIAMPVTILLLALLGHALLGLGAATALLLAAALAPTDPVLASDVQVGPPGQGREDHVRFTLTSEAGLNDGLAFPFINLALALSLVTMPPEAWLARWVAIDVVWKLFAGVAVGWLTGKLMGWLIFSLPNRACISRTGDGFVALGVTLLAYALTEMAHGYGFIAVFVAALGIRSVERNHSYHEKMHDFIEQLERLAMMLLLVLFGAALTGGSLLRGLTWDVVAFAVLAIFVIRPVSAWISLRGSSRSDERAVISFFGIRGVGSVYYLAYALNHGTFEKPEVLWSALSLIVLISVIIHGTTVTPVMRTLDSRASGRHESAAKANARVDEDGAVLQPAAE